MSELAPEIEDLKEHLKSTWNTGDYGIVAKGLESSAAEFLSRIPFSSGARVLDLACGLHSAPKLAADRYLIAENSHMF